MMQFGFQRLVLLGSAGYQRAELPLDDSVSLIAPNNTGKTSLINALQFLLIIDKRRMDFGAHEFDKTRRFYFPNNSAYILLEVSLPQSGTVVLGCVGKGVGHDYEYFAYQGPLVVEDYRLDDGRLVGQPQLIEHLASRGRLVYRYNSTEFAELVYGGRRQRAQGEPDFTVFKLENPSDARAFRQVLTRTLRLDKLNSRDVKAYLLQIFKRDLPDANIDFKQEWDKAFAEVNADRAQYDAAKKQQRRISELEGLYEQRRELRGKLLDWRPRIDQGLADWQAYYEQQSAEFTGQEQRLREQEKQQTRQDRELTEQRLQHRQRLGELLAQLNEQQQLADRFALVAERSTLEQQAQAIQQALEAQITLVNQASSRPAQSIRSELQRNQQELSALQQTLANLDDNLYLTLARHLSEAELQRLNRVLSRGALTLGSDQFQLDPQTLKATLADSSDEQLHLVGLTLRLDELNAQHHQLSRTELQGQLEDLSQRQEALAEQLEAAEAMDAARAKKQQLEKDRTAIEADLASFDRLAELTTGAEARDAERQGLEQQLAEIEAQLSESEARAEQLRQALYDVQQQQNRLDDKHRQIARIREQRGDDGEPFTFLADLDHQPWLGEPDWSLEELADKLGEYQQGCRRLLDLDRQLLTGLAELHAAGLTKFQFSDDRDTELQRIIRFSHQLEQEFEALEKKARSAVVNVTASLRELRDGLFAFKGKMREFNRLIGHRQLSDLKTFKIEPMDEPQLVEAIETLIDTASRVDSGDTFELFNHGSVLDDADLDRAKQRLIDEGNARQGLRVADLFRLVFVVGKVDQPEEAFDDIDSAASNGTVLMAKLVTGLAMLYLMQDKRHPVRTLCYLDEALALDAHNQRSLIDTASEFGFALIFASPAPLTTARYCVPIQHRDGRNHISRQSWQILESLEAET
ncbi:MAG: hypothetical protein LAT62_11830 [Natronospirillum sp.]|uniref:hypothetical protein n=1 Tax=Natronospirillum sp. TaxID=2812955 RepID=UPI0025D60C0D|nr:hypothetical protein [Natronospirillum sp.]MCH8552621.1 hypothetical protein [Natronospirillum sp.]